MIAKPGAAKSDGVTVAEPSPTTPVTPPGAGSRKYWIAVLVLATVLQIASARLFSRDLDSPNASTMIARYMIAKGEYGVMLWDRLVGEEAALRIAEPLRMFQLPSEPLFDYVVLRFLPEPLQRYAHIVFVLLLIAAVMAVGQRLAGPMAGAIAGAIMALHPWVVYHGPVRDDLMIASSCEWAAVAVLLSMFPPRSDAWRRASYVALIALAAAATLARLQSQVVLAMIAVATLAVPRFRPLRRGGVAVLIGIAVALFGWGLRNYRVTGHWVLGSSHDGFVLYESNYSHAKESIITTGQTDGLDAHYMQDDYRAAQGLDEVAVDRYYRQRGIDVLLHRPPLELLSEWCYKAVHSLLGVRSQYGLLSARNLSLMLPSLVLYVASFAGLAQLRRYRKTPEREAGWLFLGVLAVVSVGMLFIGPMAFRYQSSMVGICAVLTAIAISSRRPITSDR